MRVAIIATVVVAVAATFIATDADSQRRAKQVRVKKPEPAISQPKAAEDRRGTEQSPFIVKVAPTPKSDADRADEAKEREEKTKSERTKQQSDEKLVQFTGELAIFTKRLFFATVVLGLATIGLLVAAFRQSGEMKASIDVARRAAEAAEKATHTAQAEFVATHRPKLRIRNIVVNAPKSVVGQEFHLFAPGHFVSGQLYIANVGGSRANILDGHCKVYWTQEGLPMRRPYEGAEDNLQALSRTLLSGESTTALFRSDKSVDAELGAGTNVISSWKVYVMGWVAYSDQNNDVRRTGFCREYRRRDSSPLARFYAVDDPDYEHEE